MLAIKLQRIGKKHQPSYRVVVAEKKSKLGAPPVEDLGSYIPVGKKAALKKERILYWVGVGARPTATAHNLLVKEGVLNAAKRKIHIKAKAKAESSPSGAKSALNTASEPTPEAAPQST